MSYPGVVSVVAGGWSFVGEGWDKCILPGQVIAVNDAAIHLPHPDIIVSMDRLWTENRWDQICARRLPTYLRRAAVQNKDWERLPFIQVFECDHETNPVLMSPGPSTLNGTNSGICGINKAYTMRPQEIWLFGFDMQLGPSNQAHWYPPYAWSTSTGPKRLQEWSTQFGVIARQCRAAGIKVVNASSRSLIRDFERATPRDLRE